MQTKRMMRNENAIRYFPQPAITGNVSESAENDQIHWWKRLWLPFGIYVDMANPTPQSEIRLNLQKVVALLAILGTIAGGFWWSYQQGEESGKIKERVIADKEAANVVKQNEAKERQALLERLERAEKEARDAKTIAAAK